MSWRGHTICFNSHFTPGPIKRTWNVLNFVLIDIYFWYVTVTYSDDTNTAIDSWTYIYLKWIKTICSEDLLIRFGISRYQMRWYPSTQMAEKFVLIRFLILGKHFDPFSNKTLFKNCILIKVTFLAILKVFCTWSDFRCEIWSEPSFPYPDRVDQNIILNMVPW